MPQVFERSRLPKKPQLDPEHELASGLDNPELDSGQARMTGQDWEDEQLGINDNLVKTLLSWRAPERPFRKKTKSYYTTVGILILLISLIALLAGEKLLIGALLAFAFVIYVINFVPPREVENRLSTQGVTTDDHFYHWQQLDSFWISDKDGHKVLSILTNMRFPGLLMLLLDRVEEMEVKRICARYLPFHEIAPKSLIDRWSEGLTKHFPLEKPIS